MPSPRQTQYEAAYSKDGFFEVRDREDADRWIACDRPVEIEQ